MRKIVLLIVPTLLLGACTWGITPTAASQNIRTAWNGDVSGCRDLGTITVSVLNHVGPVQRNNITVRDELQVMARNQAVSMHADTIKPLAQPSDGSQPWGAYVCGTQPIPQTASQSPAPAAKPPVTVPSGGFKTYPIGGG